MNRLQIRTIVKGILDDLTGSDSEQYWDKNTINIYIQEAMDEIAKRTLCIKDSLTPAFCRIDVIADTIHYPVPTGILRIDSIRKSWDGLQLEKTTHDKISKSNPLWETTTSEPTKYLTDYSTGYVSIVGKLTTVTNQTFNLTVRRLPTVMSTDTNVPDVPEQFHNMAIDYILYRCFIKQDSEVFSKSTAQDYLTRFEGPQSQLGKGGNIQQILLQTNEFPTDYKARFF